MLEINIQLGIWMHNICYGGDSLSSFLPLTQYFRWKIHSEIVNSAAIFFISIRLHCERNQKKRTHSNNMKTQIPPPTMPEVCIIHTNGNIFHYGWWPTNAIVPRENVVCQIAFWSVVLYSVRISSFLLFVDSLVVYQSYVC